MSPGPESDSEKEALPTAAEVQALTAAALEHSLQKLGRLPPVVVNHYVITVENVQIVNIPPPPPPPPPLWERIAIYAFGVTFITGLLVLAIAFPNPTPFQYTVFRIVLALAAAGVAALIPGFIDIETSVGAKNLIRAGGALAVFIVVFFFSPAALEGVGLVKPSEDRVTIRIIYADIGYGTVAHRDVRDLMQSRCGHNSNVCSVKFEMADAPDRNPSNALLLKYDCLRNGQPIPNTQRAEITAGPSEQKTLDCTKP